MIIDICSQRTSPLKVFESTTLRRNIIHNLVHSSRLLFFPSIQHTYYITTCLFHYNFAPATIISSNMQACITLFREEKVQQQVK